LDVKKVSFGLWTTICNIKTKKEVISDLFFLKLPLSTIVATESAYLGHWKKSMDKLLKLKTGLSFLKMN
jgi:hypothetical protein